MGRLSHIILLVTGTVASLASAILGLMTQGSNHLGPALLYSSLACFAAGSFYLLLSFRRDHSEHRPAEKSLWLILPGSILVGLLPPLEFMLLHSKGATISLFQEVGVILFCAGSLLCIWSRCILEWWDMGDNSQETDPRLKRKGIYQTVRYPGFAGLALMALGITVGYSSTIGTFSVLSLLLPGFVYRIKLEDKTQFIDIRRGTAME